MPTGRGQLIQDVLGSAHIFSSAVDDLMQERLHAVIGEQLTFSQLKLLKLIAQSEAYNISQVAAFLGVSSAAASKAVDRLVRRELLRRTEAQSDRRAVEIALTTEGERLLGEYERMTTETLEEIFGEVTPEGLRETAARLDQLSIRLIERDLEGGEACFRCGIYFREKCLLRGHQNRQCHFHLRVRGRNGSSGLDGDGNGSRGSSQDRET
jgi:DNA-binding MarR family transcriptional regulator